MLELTLIIPGSPAALPRVACCKAKRPLGLQRCRHQRIHFASLRSANPRQSRWALLSIALRAFAITQFLRRTLQQDVRHRREPVDAVAE